MKFKLLPYSIAMLLNAFSFNSILYAATEIPLQCQFDNIYVTSKEYVLNRNLNRETQVYFMQNISNKTLVVTHPMKEVGASAGWYSYLSPMNWSAIAVVQKDFALQCYSITADEKSSIADCRNVLRLCQPSTKAIVNREGDYWLVENQPWQWFMNALHKRGVSFQ